jgi:sporulation protein YlmC with PRC-barrel domain
MSDAPIGTESELPSAQIVRGRGPRVAWLLPLGVLVLVISFVVRLWEDRGVPIRIHFDHGHGIKVGDTMRYRGIVVGEVRDVRLDTDLERVVVELELEPGAGDIAREGARFWVVRPRVAVTEVTGIETVVGARYIAALPSDQPGPPQRVFLGLEESPVLDGLVPGGLDVVVFANRAGSLAPGAPVLYRQMVVGRVTDVRMASDGNSVEANLYVEPSYAPLVRTDTRIWRASGFELQADFRGVHFRAESLQSLIMGGVAFATPDDAGQPAAPGARFELFEEPEEDWLEWQPSIPVGTDLLPPGSVRARPMRATLSWTEGRILDSEEDHSAWVLYTQDGLLGPADVLRVPDKAQEDSVSLSVGGRTFADLPPPTWERDGIGLLPLELDVEPWEAARIRRASAPEDSLLVTSPFSAPLALTASRLGAVDGVWEVDDRIPLDGSFHGAAVQSRADGALLGVLLRDGDGARVVLATP